MFSDRDVELLARGPVNKNALEDCKKIVERCGCDILTATWKGRTALHIAAGNDRTAFLEWFLLHPIDVNVLNKNGQTALMRAAEWGFTDCIQALLRRSADCSIRDNAGQTALDLAVKAERPDAVAMLEGLILLFLCCNPLLLLWLSLWL
eukprot:m.573936 g.573936  ORF g.573936 m.573936 type:complete len:149 (-) comp57883_c0_seq8:1289-1735(-)